MRIRAASSHGRLRVSHAALAIALLVFLASVARAADGPGFKAGDGKGSVTLRLAAPEGEGLALPVASGLPLPRSAVRKAESLGLYTERGEQVSAQFKPLAFWPDGSIKWVLVSLLARGGERSYRLTWGEGAASAASSPLRVDAGVGKVVVDTGVMRAVIDVRKRGLVHSLAFDANGDGQYGEGESLGEPALSSFVEWTDVAEAVRTRAGRYSDEAHPTRDVELVEAGPVRAVVRVTGEHFRRDGRASAPYAVWLSFYAGQSYFKVQHSFLLNEPASEARLRAAGVALALPGPADRLRTACDDQMVESAVGSDSVAYVLQDDVAVRRWPKLDDFSPRATVVVDGNEQAAGRRCNGFASADVGAIAVAVCMPQMLEEWPKELLLDNASRRLSALFWPLHKPEPLDLRPLMERTPLGLLDFLKTPAGERWMRQPPAWRMPSGRAQSKSHSLFCSLRRRDEEAPLALVSAAEKPGALVASPAYEAHCGVAPSAGSPNTVSLPELGARLAAACDGLEADHRWSGFVDRGDVPRCYSASQDAWDLFGAGWSNGAGELAYSFFSQYLRTGKRQHLDVALSMVRHSIDLDTLRSIDRSAPRAWPCRPGPDHGMPGALAHLSPMSLAMAYFTTGDRRVAETLEELLAGAEGGQPDKLTNRDLSRLVTMAAVVLEMRPGESLRAKVAAYAGLLASRVARMKPDGDWEGYVLPALAYAYRVTDDAKLLAALKSAVDAAWPKRACLLGLGALYRATGDAAYAKAAAFSLWRQASAPRPERKQRWLEDELGLRAWAGVAEGIGAVADAGLGTWCDGLSGAVAARRAQAKADSAKSERARFTPLDLASVCNAPASGVTRRVASEGVVVLLAGDVGFDFGSDEALAPGFIAVTPEHVYPSKAGAPSPLEGFAALPFGGTPPYVGIPFALAQSGASGNAVVVIGRGPEATVDVGVAGSKLHLLSGVCLNRTVDNAVGARVTLEYEDGDEETVELRNFEHYQPAALPPVFVAPEVRLAAELPRAHVGVLSLPLKPKKLARVRLASGDADHRVVVLAMTVEHKGPAVPREGQAVDVEWNLSENFDTAKELLADVAPGEYALDVVLSASGRVAIDVAVCGRDVLQNVMPNRPTRVALPAVACDGRLTVRATAKPLDPLGEVAWDVAVPAVRLVRERGAGPGPRTNKPAIVYGWAPGPDYVGRAVLQVRQRKARAKVDALLDDSCMPSPGSAGPRSFWIGLANGRYEVKLFMRSANSGPCTVDVRAEGEMVLEGLKLDPEIADDDKGKPKAATFTVTVYDGRLDLDIGAASPAQTWEWCAMIVRPVEADGVEKK